MPGPHSFRQILSTNGRMPEVLLVPDMKLFAGNATPELAQRIANRLYTSLGAEMGLTLGADVPVFVRGHAAFAEGVGEILTPVDPPEKWYLVAHPGVSIPTPVIFKDPELGWLPHAANAVSVS